MGAYSGVGAYLSSSGSEVGAYSGGGLIREWGLNQSFTVFIKRKIIYKEKSGTVTKVKLLMKIKLIYSNFILELWL